MTQRSNARAPSFLGSLVGASVQRISRTFYEYQGSIDDRDDGALELELDRTTVVFDTGADGESLSIQEQRWIDPFEPPLTPENQEFVESSGKWSRFDVSSDEGYRELVGAKLESVRPLMSSDIGVCGVMLEARGVQLWFVVEFDESTVSWTHPPGLMLGE